MSVDLRISLGLEAPPDIVDRETFACSGELERTFENVKRHIGICHFERSISINPAMERVAESEGRR